MDVKDPKGEGRMGGDKMTVARIRVDLNMASGRYMAIKDYGDDLGYLEEIGEGVTPAEAIRDLIEQVAEYNDTFKG
jgi:hypothetical protein